MIKLEAAQLHDLRKELYHLRQTEKNMLALSDHVVQLEEHYEAISARKEAISQAIAQQEQSLQYNLLQGQDQLTSLRRGHEGLLAEIHNKTHELKLLHEEFGKNSLEFEAIRREMIEQRKAGQKQAEESSKLAQKVLSLKEERSSLQEELVSLERVQSECLLSLEQIEESGRQSKVNHQKLQMSMEQAKRDHELLSVQIIQRKENLAGLQNTLRKICQDIREVEVSMESVYSFCERQDSEASMVRSQLQNELEKSEYLQGELMGLKEAIDSKEKQSEALSCEVEALGQKLKCQSEVVRRQQEKLQLTEVIARQYKQLLSQISQ